MKKLFITLIMGMLLVSCQQQTEKTAFVDLNKVVEDYNEMKQVKADFENKQKDLQKKYDSIALAFQQKYQKFLAKANSMNQKKAQEEYNRLLAEQQNIQMLQQRDFQQLQADFDKATEEVSDKLKKFMEKYGEQNGYTYIFSRSELAGIAYGKKDKDITEDFIKALNEEKSGNTSGKQAEKKEEKPESENKQK